MNRARFSANGRHAVRALAVVAAVATILAAGPRLAGQIARTGWTVVAWNNLGMHCMDADFSVFAILPPYNTIQAQVVDASGHLVKDGSVTVTYEAVADASGSINTTSIGKTGFWQYVGLLFGPGAVGLPEDTGLPPVGIVPQSVQQRMPGPTNTPRPMQFDSRFNWYIAEGIPITPYDDLGRKNYYPMMRVTARNGSTVYATTDIVLPVSDEMDCRACHASGSGPAARPAAGWVNETKDAQRDFRLNILRLHDEKNGTTLFASAYSANKPTLCASCHPSEALGGGGDGTISPLTAAIHRLHAGVTDPTNGQTLGSSTNRTACYRCHPGSDTRCLRGVMGSAVTVTNGIPALAIQCQNCHGSMSDVGAPPPGGPCDPSTLKPPCPAPTRTGWFDEPTCQACHTGTATTHLGDKIRLTSVVDPLLVKDQTFATNADTPLPGKRLYRFSSGHAGLQCSACHGSTHAEYASSHTNDNVQSNRLQGHVGTIAECGSCHTAGVPMTGNGGPHGMHPVGSWWVDKHHDYINGNLAQCQACHGSDYRGTELSRAFAARTFTTELGTRSVFRGATVGCYMCHNGPFSSNATPNRAPVAANVSVSSSSASGGGIQLAATDADGNALAFRIVSQPTQGMVAIDPKTVMNSTNPQSAIAVYRPYVGASGTDTFTYTAWDGSVDSNLATVTVNVIACTTNVTASAPTTATVNSPVSFTASATSSNCGGTATYDWYFGDGSAHSTAQNPSHTYTNAGTFTWTLTATVAGVTTTRSGNITVSGGTTCTVTATATAPTAGTVNTPVSFSSTVNASGCSGGVSYAWNFGDGNSSTQQNPSHAYTSTGTYTWRFQASAGGVSSTPQGGTITISTSQASGPVITSIQQLSNPFRVRINGSNFRSGVRVYIGNDQTAWPNVTRNDNGTRLTLSGTGLASKFPVGQAVAIRVVNPDGTSATGTFTRR